MIDYSNDKLFEGINGFYKDADNRKLDIEYALLYVEGQQKGLSIKSLNELLVTWKKQAN